MTAAGSPAGATDGADGEASASEDERARLLNSSGGVEKKPDEDSKTPPVWGAEKLPGSRSRSREGPADRPGAEDREGRASAAAGGPRCWSAVPGTEAAGSALLMTQGSPDAPLDGDGAPDASGTGDQPEGAGLSDTGVERWPPARGTRVVPTRPTPPSAAELPPEGEERATTGREGKSVLNGWGSSPNSNSEKSATPRLGGGTPLACGVVTDRVSAPSPEPTSSPSGRLADATGRGDATRQDTHHV